MDALTALRKVPIFALLGTEGLKEIAVCSSTRRVEAEVAIVREGDAGHTMFVVLNGEVEVSRLNSHGDRVPFHRLGPGEWFGEMSLVGGASRSADVIALIPTTLLVIDRDAFVRFVLSSPPACLQVMAHLCRRIRQSDDARLSSSSVRERLCHELIRLGVPFGPEGIALEIARSKLGERIQARRETVSRILSDMAAEGLVEIYGKRIVVHKPERLH